MAKVFDAHGVIHADTKKAQADIDALAKRVDKMGPGLNRFGDHMSYADRAASSLSRRLRSGFMAGFANSAARGENSMIQLGNALEVAGAGFKKIDNESTIALKRFQSLQRRAYSLQSALGALAGGIGDLAGGFLGLVGVAAQASYSLIAIGSALTSVVAGFIVAKIAMGGVGKALGQLWSGQNQYNKALRDAKKELRDLRFELEGAVLSEQEAAIGLEKARTQLAMAQDLPPDNMVRREAELAYQQADLNYRRAKAKVKDLQDTIKRGGDQQAKLAAANPFKNMTKSQIAFTKFLLTLKPQVQALKEAASSSFLPPLTEGISLLAAKLLPSLLKGFNLLGSAMGQAAKSFSELITTPENIKLLDEFFKNSVPTLEAMGRIAGKTFGGILGLLEAAKPLTDRFVAWVERVAESFEKTVKSPAYKEFLTLAGDVAAGLGKVIGTFSDGIGNLMRATFTPGGAGYVIIDWLQGIAQGFKDFTGAADFPKWLKDSTTNATMMLSVVGDFLHIFLDLAGAPETRQFFQILSKSIPDLTKIFMDGIKAAPAFAGLIVSITEMFALLSDSGALESFFTTLKVIVDMFNGLIKPITWLLNWIGTIHGFFLAIGLAVGALATGFMIFFAILGKIAKTFGQLFNVISSLLGAMTRYNHVLAANTTANGTMQRQISNQPGLFERIRMAIAKQTVALKSTHNVYKAMPSVMAQYRTILERLNNRTAANMELLKQQGGGFRVLAARVKIHTAALKTAMNLTKDNIGLLKQHNRAVRAAYDEAKKEVLASRNSSVAKKEQTGVIKRHAAALKAALFGMKEANAEDKKAPGVLKLLGNSYNAVKTSVNTYRESLRLLKRVRQGATSAAQVETTATKAATAEYTRGAAAARLFASSRKFAGMNTGRGFGGGAGTKIFGGAMVAEGLIGAATGTGNQTGNILATLGGAAMFSGNPYAMGAGAIASIAGTAINAINAAEESKRQQRLSVIADRVQLDAQIVNQTAARANAEALQLVRSNQAPTIQAAQQIVADRSKSAVEATNVAIREFIGKGGVLTELEKTTLGDLVSAVRTEIDMSGKVKSGDRAAILEAAARAALSSPGLDAGTLAETLLSTYGSNKNIKAVTKKFGSVSSLVSQSGTLPGEAYASSRLVDASNTITNQVKKIIPSLVSSNMFTAGISGTGETKQVLNTSVLKERGIFKEAVAEYLKTDPQILQKNSGLREALDAYLKDTVVSPTDLGGLKTGGRKYEIYNPNNKGLTTSTGTNPYARYGVNNFNPTTMAYSQTSPFFLSNQLSKNKATKVEIVPSATEIAKMNLDGTRAQNTEKLISKLAGVVDSTGSYLMIKDASKTDSTPPQIQIPKTGISLGERLLYEGINKAMKSAFERG